MVSSPSPAPTLLSPSYAGTATAVWFPAARTVELRDEPVPEPGAGEVRIRTLASAISPGTELLVYRGQVPPDLELDLPTLRGGFGFPIKYGYACAGVVDGLGAAVQGAREGDLVFVHHPHQTAFVVPSAAAVPLPEGVSAQLGTFVANLETAANVLLDAAPRLGERVLVFGQGVVGLLVAALARRAGSGLVATVDPVRTRREMSLRLGAHAALDPASVRDAARDLTRGVGFDVVVEVSGNPDALSQAIDCAAFQGTVVVSSWYGSKPSSVMLGGAFHRRRLRLVSSQVSNLDPALTPRWSRQRRLELARDLLATLPLEQLITHRVPFLEAARAYDLLDRGSESAIQVVLTYD